VKPIITCACGCGQTGPHAGRGLLTRCYRRARHHGQLELYPRRPIDSRTRDQLITTLKQIHRQLRVARMEDYVDLREWGVPRRAAEERLGVTDRTTQRWHATLRAQGARYSWLPAVPDHLTPATYPKAGIAA
jgi:hypothetical protein